MVFIVPINVACKGIVPVYQEQHGMSRGAPQGSVRAGPGSRGPSHSPGQEQGSWGHQEHPQTWRSATSLGTGQDIYTIKTLLQRVCLCWQSYTQMPFSCVLITYLSATHHISGKLRFPWFFFLCYNPRKLHRELWGKLVTAQGVARKSC